MPLHLPVKRSTGPVLVIAASLLLVAGTVWFSVAGRTPASVEPPPAQAESLDTSPLPESE